MDRRRHRPVIRKFARTGRRDHTIEIQAGAYLTAAADPCRATSMMPPAASTAIPARTN
jgi:hypothetical protein